MPGMWSLKERRASRHLLLTKDLLLSLFQGYPLTTSPYTHLNLCHSRKISNDSLVKRSSVYLIRYRPFPCPRQLIRYLIRKPQSTRICGSPQLPWRQTWFAQLLHLAYILLTIILCHIYILRITVGCLPSSYPTLLGSIRVQISEGNKKCDHYSWSLFRRGKFLICCSRSDWSLQ